MAEEEVLDVKVLAGMLRDAVKSPKVEGVRIPRKMVEDLIEALDPPAANVTNAKSIELFLHCVRCLRESRPSNLEVGWTGQGIQVWCKNHDCNIVHIDFEGRNHPANETASVVVH